MESLARLALAIARLHLPAQLTSGSIPENTAFCVPFRGCGVAIAGVRTYDIWTLLWTSDGVMKARDRDKTGRRGSERGRENLQLTRDLFWPPSVCRGRFLFCSYFGQMPPIVSFLTFCFFRREEQHEINIISWVENFHRLLVLWRSLPRRLPSLRVRSFRCRAALHVFRRRLRARIYECHVMSCHVM